jgi:iron complex transport system substrate-binding protein
LKPDLAVFSIAGEGPTQHSPVADLLAKAGVPVLFIDFRVHPIENTRVSLRALGTLLDREQQAEQYLSLYDRHLKQVTDAVAGLPDSQRPKVFLELLAGVWQAPGHTTGKSGLGSLVAAVGGHNIGADVVPGALGDVSVEYVLQADPTCTSPPATVRRGAAGGRRGHRHRAPEPGAHHRPARVRAAAADPGRAGPWLVA